VEYTWHEPGNKKHHEMWSFIECFEKTKSRKIKREGN
jgi:hypothetical protein